MALEKAPHSSVFPELACTHGSHLLRWGGVGLQDQSSAQRNLNGACSSHEPLLPVQPAPAHSQGDTHTLFCPELASYFQETPSFMPHCGAVRGAAQQPVPQHGAVDLLAASQDGAGIAPDAAMAFLGCPIADIPTIAADDPSARDARTNPEASDGSFAVGILFVPEFPSIMSGAYNDDEDTRISREEHSGGRAFGVPIRVHTCTQKRREGDDQTDRQRQGTRNDWNAGSTSILRPLASELHRFRHSHHTEQDTGENVTGSFIPEELPSSKFIYGF